MNRQALEKIVLGVITGADGPLTDRELAEATGVAVAEIHSVLDCLVGDGKVVQTGQKVRRVFSREGDAKGRGMA